jgi:hypothetical protein
MLELYVPTGAKFKLKPEDPTIPYVKNRETTISTNPVSPAPPI